MDSCSALSVVLQANPRLPYNIVLLHLFEASMNIVLSTAIENSLRKNFEAWWDKHQTLHSSRNRYDDGQREYTNVDTQQAWEVWLASYQHCLVQETNRPALLESDIDASRQEFETWWMKIHSRNHGYGLNCDSSGNYVNFQTQQAWKIWTASRQQSFHPENCIECRGSTFEKRFDGSMICVNCKLIYENANTDTGYRTKESDS